ncbi:MAG: dihydrofolate reductase [Acidobacteria bacterium]|nr:dihydrofolate reductase [Acidobacteriota bacterium]
MAIIGIVAIAKNYAIGKDGKLPWHYSADLRFFKQTTTGNAIVMGASTWKSLGRPLPSRLNVVLSRISDIEPQLGVLLIRSRDEVLELSRYLKGDVFIIGGARTFETFADVIEKWIVTEIPETVEDADVFMPEDFLEAFETVRSDDLGDGLMAKTFHRKAVLM